MGKFLAVSSAYLLICSGYQIFRVPFDPLIQYLIPFYIFLTAVFLLLYDLRLYPKPLRKLDKLSQTAVEFLVAVFLMENIILDFWIPLQDGTASVTYTLAEKLDEINYYEFYPLRIITEILETSIFNTCVIYILSIFFLLSCLHAIRAVDFRALDEGPSCFFSDIVYRSKRFMKKKFKTLGLQRKKRVKILETEDMVKKRKKSEKDVCNCNLIDNDIKLDNLSVQDYGLDDLDDLSFKFSDFDIPSETELLSGPL
ncbi:uncharacterized protein LOC114324601 [Diabrotica virgifera virgifera]|uniref:Uncharacterized protein LOC114324601 n=1 Tax=Diabrotica virgifera virgifera TaxID=50390 RepID=A0A6P7F080_DIAVI|nr:uncharacterized protein LOC114324601 [Diabrotica virgifera virgifera]